MSARGDIIIFGVEIGWRKQEKLIDPLWVARCIQTNLISTVTETSHMEFLRYVLTHRSNPICPPCKDHVFSLF